MYLPMGFTYPWHFLAASASIRNLSVYWSCGSLIPITVLIRRRRLRSPWMPLNPMVWLSSWFLHVYWHCLDSAMPFRGYGANWILSSLRAVSSEDLSAVDIWKEFMDYIQSPWENTQDPVRWWGVCVNLIFLCKFVDWWISIMLSNILLFPHLLGTIWPFKVLQLHLKGLFWVVVLLTHCIATAWTLLCLEKPKFLSMLSNPTFSMLPLKQRLIWHLNLCRLVTK